jgi:uncharacterized protein
MSEDLMHYDQLAQRALRGVVREALKHVERHGLPGEHHFYIAFDTRHAGVLISPKLLGRYPREMTIVLQHQYSDLKVMDDSFTLVLYFDQTPEKLIVPFEAVKGFLDPSVQFGLQFEVVAVEPKEATDDKDVAEIAAAKKEKAIETDDVPPEQKVVSLDAFRKK